MLDYVAIFTKGGISLWCYNSTNEFFDSYINNLIRGVILQEKSTEENYFEDKNLAMRFKLDNELDLIYVFAFQKVVHVLYLEKLISEIQITFKIKYKSELLSANKLKVLYEFNTEFLNSLLLSETWAKLQYKIPKHMRSFDESSKSRKNVASMIESVNYLKSVDTKAILNVIPDNSLTSRKDLIIESRRKLKEKLLSKKSQKVKTKEPEKIMKKPRIWELGGDSRDIDGLDRSRDHLEDSNYEISQNPIVGTMKGDIDDLQVDSALDPQKKLNITQGEYIAKSGILSIFKGIVGSKHLSVADLQPKLDKLRDHLITKNVAADIALKLCESVAFKLDGRILGTFESVASLVKDDLTSSLVQILSPKQRIDILRDALEAKKISRPYVLTFCGVNGVGKSTNLAKICFWLIENNFNVLIAACDTFRAGAVEQLRTHTKHLNVLHPAEEHSGRIMVQLYEKGYGKDAAGIALEAIKYAKDASIDVVLVDTAGRMQDNEPLMRALAKLIKLNDPDLVLFVGEALVGNEAVDQLVKFNQALADYSLNEKPHTIDGIILTKFDTIDDKVGAAVSMTYITGKPIVFIGDGQTYTDLKRINAKAVVNCLMK